MMVAMQKLAAPNGSTGNWYGSGCVVFIDAAAAPEQFPVGLRVLVVDDDITCLKILERMLRKCRYHVTTCSQAMAALSLLRERKGCFDVIISDVHMPDMDGFKLLQLVGLEMDLPVIMMSADGRTSAVMRGIKHGACDYLIKPVRMEELKNIWQHLVRKKWNENKDVENSGSFEDSERQRLVADESECASSENNGMDASWKTLTKKRDSKDGEDDAELDDEDPSVSKKPRVVWSVELHQQFVNAVSQVGIDKAVPKRILELMNVPGLTRENVASHLQKFRLYLRRISGVTQNQAVLPTLFCNQGEASTKWGSLESLDFQSLAASGQVPPQTLAALHAELFCHPSGNLVFPAVNQPVLLQASPQGSQFVSLENEVAFGQPLFKCQSGVQKQQFTPSKITTVQDMASEFSSWSSNQLGVKGSTNKHPGLGNTQDNSLLMQMLQHQQQHEHHPESFHPMVSDSINVINVQPSCLVIPSQSLSGKNGVSNAGPISQRSLVLSPQPSRNIQLGSNALLATSSSSLSSCTTAFHYSNLSSHLMNPPLGIVHASNGDFKNIGMLKSCYPPASTSPAVSSSSFCTSSSACWREPNSKMKIGSINRTPVHFPNLCIQDSELDSGASVKEGQFRNLGFVGKGTCLPSRFAVDDLEPLTNDQSFTRTSTVDDVDKLKQENNLDLFYASKIGNAMLPNNPPSDSLGVLSKYV